MKKDPIKNMFPHGACECADGMPGGCCMGRGPAAFEVLRDGKKMRVCTRCDFSSDEPTRKLLVRGTDPMSIYSDFDGLGALCLAFMLSEQTKSN